MVAESARDFESNPSPASREAHRLRRNVDIRLRGKLWSIELAIAAWDENLTLLLSRP